METIGYINLFEKLTHAHVKDCFIEDGKLTFVVNQGEIGKAVGKQGVNIRELGYKLKKPVKIIEFNENAGEFLKNLLFPLRPSKITVEDETIIIKTRDTREKGQIYGREKTNLKRIQALLNKYFPYEIKVE